MMKQKLNCKRKVTAPDLKYATLSVHHGGGSAMAWACIVTSMLRFNQLLQNRQSFTE